MKTCSTILLHVWTKEMTKKQGFHSLWKFLFCCVFPSSWICKFLPCHHLSLISMSGLHLESASSLKLKWQSHSSKSSCCFAANCSPRFKLYLFYKLPTSLRSLFLMHSVAIIVLLMTATSKSKKLHVSLLFLLPPSIRPFLHLPYY